MSHKEMEGQLAALPINETWGTCFFVVSHPPLEKRIEALRNLDSLNGK